MKIIIKEISMEIYNFIRIIKRYYTLLRQEY